MPITINGSGTVTGISAGGLPDGCIVAADIADNNVTTAKIDNGSITQDKIATTVVIVPVGAVFYFAANIAPIGYLKCNGDTVTDGVGTVQSVTANFSALYAVLSSTYGSPGKLPDLRGEFIRGWDDARGVDSGRAFGSAQAQGYQSHNHAITDPGHQHVAYFDINQGGDPTSTYAFNGISQFVGRVTSFAGTNITINNSGGTETRPRNIALLACIKY